MEPNSYKPLARKDGLIVSEIDGEIVVYDGDDSIACCLNPSAALVWRYCDGEHTIADLHKIVAAEYGEVADEDVVLLALDTLSEHGLIESGYEKREPTTTRLTRRRFIRRVGLVGGAAVMLPVVSSLVVPSAAAAASILLSYTPGYGYAHEYYHHGGIYN
jgi:hypothetical protein